MRYFRARVGLWAAAIVSFMLSISASASVTDIDALLPDLRSPLNAYPDSDLTYADDFGTSQTVVFDERNFGPVDPIASFPANSHAAWLSSDGGASAHNFLNQEGFTLSFNLTLDTNEPSSRKEAGVLISNPVAGTGRLIVATDNGDIATFGSFLPFTTNLFDDGDGAEYGGTPYSPGTTLSIQLIYRPGIGTPIAGDLVEPATIEFIIDGISSGPRATLNIQNGIVDGTRIGFYAHSQVDPPDAAMTVVTAAFENVSIVPEPTAAAYGLIAALPVLRPRSRARST